MKPAEPTPSGPKPSRGLSQGRGTPSQKKLRLEGDGETHRRDCECARCEAGFTPSERERAVAERRAAKKQGQLAAVRSAERRKTKEALHQMDLAAYFARGTEAADAEIARLRAARAKALTDRRAEALLELRSRGWELGQAIAEIDRRFPPDEGSDNDNGRRPAMKHSHPTQLTIGLRDR